MRSAHTKRGQCSMNGSTISTLNEKESLPPTNEFEMVRSESAFAGVNSDPAGGFRFVENGGRPIDKSKPLKFTDAVRLHESLSAHNVSL